MASGDEPLQSHQPLGAMEMRFKLQRRSRISEESSQGVERYRERTLELRMRVFTHLWVKTTHV